MGAGRTELVSTIFGEKRPEAGEIRIGGHLLGTGRTRDAVRQKIALVPEDRKNLGLNLTGSVADKSVTRG